MKSMSQLFDYAKQPKLGLQICSRKLKIDEWFFPSITKKGLCYLEILFIAIDAIQLLH